VSTDKPSPQGGDPSPDTFKVRRRARRHVTKDGNSQKIAIPPEFMSRLGILPGSDVDLILYDEHGGFFVKPILPANVTGDYINTSGRHS